MSHVSDVSNRDRIEMAFREITERLDYVMELVDDSKNFDFYGFEGSDRVTKVDRNHVVNAATALRYFYSSQLAYRDKYLEYDEQHMARGAGRMADNAREAWEAIWSILSVGEPRRKEGIMIQEVYDALVSGLNLESEVEMSHFNDLASVDEFTEVQRDYEKMEEQAYDNDVRFQLNLLWGRLAAGCVNEQCHRAPSKVGKAMQFVRGDPGENPGMAGPGMPAMEPHWFCEECEAAVKVGSMRMEREILEWIGTMDVEVEVI